MSKLAIIRIRGHVRLSRHVKYTLELLKLNKTNSCVLKEDTHSLRGMLQKTTRYITWGEADAATEKKIDTTPKHLTPPRGGFERKGVKMPYNKGGALGYRGAAINELITRMLP